MSIYTALGGRLNRVGLPCLDLVITEVTLNIDSDEIRKLGDFRALVKNP